MIVDNKLKDSRCPVCECGVSGGVELFCPSHKIALNNIRKGYDDWVNAYRSLTKEKYLHLLAENANAGEWVVGVAEYLLRENMTEKI